MTGKDNVELIAFQPITDKVSPKKKGFNGAVHDLIISRTGAERVELAK